LLRGEFIALPEFPRAFGKLLKIDEKP
jgi:hypothetical protein